MLGLGAARRVDFGWDGVGTSIFFRPVLEFFERRDDLKKQAHNTSRIAAKIECFMCQNTDKG